MSAIYDLRASDMSNEEWDVIHNFATNIYKAESKGEIYSKANYDPFIQDLIYTIIIDSIKKSKENSIEMLKVDEEKNDGSLFSESSIGKETKDVPIQSKESAKRQVTRDGQELEQGIVKGN